MADLDLHDVLVLRHRPVRAIEALPAVMYRVFAPQAGEIGVVGIILVEFGIADVDVVERHAVGMVENRDVIHRTASRSGDANVALPACARSARPTPRAS